MSKDPPRALLPELNGSFANSVSTSRDSELLQLTSALEVCTAKSLDDSAGTLNSTRGCTDPALWLPPQMEFFATYPVARPYHNVEPTGAMSRSTWKRRQSGFLASSELHPPRVFAPSAGSTGSNTKSHMRPRGVEGATTCAAPRSAGYWPPASHWARMALGRNSEGVSSLNGADSASAVADNHLSLS